MVEVLKALADDSRFKIIKLLLKHKHCVRALSAKLNISEPAVSQHLKILKNNNLVYCQKNGYFMQYFINSDKLSEIVKDLSDIIKKENKSEE